MKHLFSLIMAGFFVCSPAINAQSITADSIWSTVKELDVPESSYFSHTQKMIFVSNISGNSGEKDKSGFISKVSTNGAIIDKQWISGFNAPKGIIEFDKKLYVSDIDELVEIDIEHSIIVNKYPATESKFLNDVTVDTNGNVYVSDMQDQSIYILKDGKLEKWIKNEMLDNVNGLFFHNNSVFAGTSNSIVKIDAKTKEMEIWATNTGSIDGLESDGKSGFFFSDWKGQVFHVEKGKSPSPIINKTSQNINAADIGFDKETNHLFVPTFFDNRVIAYKVTFK